VLLDELSETNVISAMTANSSDPRLKSLAEKRSVIVRTLAAKERAATKLAGLVSSEQIASIGKEIEAARKELTQLDGLIKEADPKFEILVRPQSASLASIQQQLDPDSVLLEYSLGNPRSYVWAVTSNSIDGFQLPARNQIEAAANRITKSLDARNQTINDETSTQGERRRDQANKDFERASAELSELVIRPLAPLLGNKRLVIVADGALQRVSFAALPLPRAGAQQQRRLIEDHEIVYEPSASVLALQRRELENRKPAARAVAVLADPVFDKDDSRVASALPRTNPPRNGSKSNGNTGPEIATQKRDVSRALEDIGLERFPRLSSSAYEAQRIMAVAPKGDNKEALDFDASRETATSSELSNYRVVHFATHAVVNYEHPELSGIVFSLVDRTGQPQDGYLRLHDIYNLNLPADLVVLSACQTGVGKEIKGEGLIALTRGFMYAGAARVVASLWKVDDAVTASLMAEFYKQMFVSGQRPAAALRSAQMTLAKTKRPPADWAGFVLQGEWK
jgi:CHAT domain-containing protein